MLKFIRESSHILSFHDLVSIADLISVFSLLIHTRALLNSYYHQYIEWTYPPN